MSRGTPTSDTVLLKEEKKEKEKLILIHVKTAQLAF